jgi:hypothetical protein
VVGRRFTPKPFVNTSPAASVAGLFIITLLAMMNKYKSKVFDFD